MVRAELEIRQAVINAHGGPMREQTVQEWRVWLAHLKHDEGLQLIKMNEVTDRIYRAVLVALGPRWEVERRHDRPGSDEVLLAVRRDVGVVSGTRSLRMGGGRWIGRHTGRLHTARQMLEVAIDTDVLVLMAAVLHAPPSVDVELQTRAHFRRTPRLLRKWSRRMTILRGKADRVLAWRRYWSRFRRWANGINRLGIPWVAGGDVQEPQRARGWTSPVDTATRVGGRAEIRGIDGWIHSRGTDVRDVKVVPPGPGMDHRVTISTLVIPYRGEESA